MANDGSVAPKERVNIVYRPVTGDAREEVELPLKQLVLGDFTLRESDTLLEDRKQVGIDKDNFNDVLKAQHLTLDLALPDRLSKGGDADSLAVTLRFQEMRDFEPDALVRQVPELRRLIELREALKALKGPLGNRPEFRSQLSRLLKDDSARVRLVNELELDSPKEP